MGDNSLALTAHLLRRAGFGATRDELKAYVANGYEATVEELLNPTDPRSMPDDILRRYHTDTSATMGPYGGPLEWIYRMITTNSPLREKLTLFWHGIFATSMNKVMSGKPLVNQIDMFRRRGFGNFRTLLVELSRDPAMIYWLDNNENHKGATNENYGRELLELFSMGAGNYTEDDIKEASRAFTGWSIGNAEYMVAMAKKGSVAPYGRLAWHFQYNLEDHDDGEKEFLGHRGRFNGEDIVDIICQQPATARFISRHMYSFFVADEPPVPKWPYTPPRDPEAIETLSQTYFDTNYDIGSMLRVLFSSDFFRSQSSWYQKVKSPAELIIGVLRLTGEFDKEPRPDIQAVTGQMAFMGQQLLSPLSVEGWHGGLEWTDSGTLVERVNFAAKHLGDMSASGVRAIVGRLTSDYGGVLSPERLVDACLDQLGAISVPEDTRSVLVASAAKSGDLDTRNLEAGGEAEQRVGDLLQLIASAPEFQLA